MHNSYSREFMQSAT